MRFRFALVAFATLLAPLAALADDEPASYQAIQRRQYQMSHELKLGPGYLPLDAFYKGVTANVGYVYHFNDHFAWQVGRMTLSRSINTGLRKQIERSFGLLTTEFPEVQWIAGSDLLVSPIYGKTALFNSVVVHLQMYLLAGGSGVKTQIEVAPALSVGAGVRFFIAQWISLRLEASNHAVIGTQKFNVVDLQGSVAFNLGGRD